MTTLNDLLAFAVGQPVAIDKLRRQLRTSKSDVVAQATVMPGVTHDAIAGTLTLVASPADLPDDGAADEFADQPYDEFPESPTVDEEFVEGTDYGVETDEADDSDEDEEPVTNFRFPDRKKAEYEEKDGNCGDDLAVALSNFLNDTTLVPRKDGKGTKKVTGISMTALWRVADDNRIATVKGNNNGQMRMNLSNMLRAKWRKGDDIRVGDTTIRGLTNYKTRKQWIEENAAARVSATGCKPTAALLLAEQEFEVKSESGEFVPERGEFV